MSTLTHTFMHARRHWGEWLFSFVTIPLVLGFLAFVAVRLVESTVPPRTPLLQARLSYFDASHGDLHRRIAASADPAEAAAAARQVMACVHERLAALPGMTDHQIEGWCVQEQLDAIEATHLDMAVVTHRRALLRKLGFSVPIQIGD